MILGVILFPGIVGSVALWDPFRLLFMAVKIEAYIVRIGPWGVKHRIIILGRYGPILVVASVISICVLSQIPVSTNMQVGHEMQTSKFCGGQVLEAGAQ